MAKDSLHVGLSVLRTVAEEAICSPSTIMTATGSGKLKRSRLMRFEAPCTCAGQCIPQEEASKNKTDGSE